MAAEAVGGGGRGYPPLAAAIKESGFEDIGGLHHKEAYMVAQYIATQPILNLCERSVKWMGVWVSGRW